MDGAEWWADQKHALQYVLGKPTTNARETNVSRIKRATNKQNKHWICEQGDHIMPVQFVFMRRESSAGIYSLYEKNAHYIHLFLFTKYC